MKKGVKKAPIKTAKEIKKEIANTIKKELQKFICSKEIISIEKINSIPEGRRVNLCDPRALAIVEEIRQEMENDKKEKFLSHYFVLYETLEQKYSYFVGALKKLNFMMYISQVEKTNFYYEYWLYRLLQEIGHDCMQLSALINYLNSESVPTLKEEEKKFLHRLFEQCSEIILQLSPDFEKLLKHLEYKEKIENITDDKVTVFYETGPEIIFDSYIMLISIQIAIFEKTKGNSEIKQKFHDNAYANLIELRKKLKENQNGGGAVEKLNEQDAHKIEDRIVGYFNILEFLNLNASDPQILMTKRILEISTIADKILKELSYNFNIFEDAKKAEDILVAHHEHFSDLQTKKDIVNTVLLRLKEKISENQKKYKQVEEEIIYVHRPVVNVLYWILYSLYRKYNEGIDKSNKEQQMGFYWEHLHEFFMKVTKLYLGIDSPGNERIEFYDEIWIAYSLAQNYLDDEESQQIILKTTCVNKEYTYLSFIRMRLTYCDFLKINDNVDEAKKEWVCCLSALEKMKINFAHKEEIIEKIVMLEARIALEIENSEALRANHSLPEYQCLEYIKKLRFEENVNLKASQADLELVRIDLQNLAHIKEELSTIKTPEDFKKVLLRIFKDTVDIFESSKNYSIPVRLCLIFEAEKICRSWLAVFENQERSFRNKSLSFVFSTYLDSFKDFVKNSPNIDLEYVKNKIFVKDITEDSSYKIENLSKDLVRSFHPMVEKITNRSNFNQKEKYSGGSILLREQLEALKKSLIDKTISEEEALSNSKVLFLKIGKLNSLYEVLMLFKATQELFLAWKEYFSPKENASQAEKEIYNNFNVLTEISDIAVKIMENELSQAVESSQTMKLPLLLEEDKEKRKRKEERRREEEKREKEKEREREKKKEKEKEREKEKEKEKEKEEEKTEKEKKENKIDRNKNASHDAIIMGYSGRLKKMAISSKLNPSSNLTKADETPLERSNPSVNAQRNEKTPSKEVEVIEEKAPKKEVEVIEEKIQNKEVEMIESKKRLSSENCKIIARWEKLLPEIEEVMSAVSEKGSIYLAGGTLRRFLRREKLNEKRLVDLDFVSGCTREQITEIYPYCGTWTKIRRKNTTSKEVDELEVFTLRPGVQIVLSTFETLKEKAMQCDIIDNTLFMDLEGNIFAPYDDYHLVNTSMLYFIGDSNERLADESHLILRLTRFKHELKKELFEYDLLSMKAHAPKLCTIAWNVHVSNIEALFMRRADLADLNFQFLIKHEILFYFYSEKKYDLPQSLEQFWTYALYRFHHHENDKKNVYDLVALFSLLQALPEIKLSGFEKGIEETVNKLQSRFSFDADAKNKIQSGLKIYHQEYEQYRPAHIHSKASIANRNGAGNAVTFRFDEEKMRAKEARGEGSSKQSYSASKYGL